MNTATAAVTALGSQVDDLYGYVQERCLWQFYSRTWDRTENIDGVLAQATKLLLGQATARETPTERLHAVDAKVMVDDFYGRFPWLKDSSEEEIRELMRELHAKITDIAITRSHNRELTHTLY